MKKLIAAFAILAFAAVIVIGTTAAKSDAKASKHSELVRGSIKQSINVEFADRVLGYTISADRTAKNTYRVYVDNGTRTLVSFTANDKNPAAVKISDITLSNGKAPSSDLVDKALELVE